MTDKGVKCDSCLEPMSAAKGQVYVFRGRAKFLCPQCFPKYVAEVQKISDLIKDLLTL